MKSINLLPKERQRELRYGIICQGLITVVWVSVFSIATAVLVQFGVRFILEARLSTVEARITAIQQQMDKQDNANLKNQVKAINDNIADYKQLAETNPKWSKFIKTFAKIPPPGVRVEALTIDPIKKIVTIRGYSPTREVLLEFNDRLKAESSFSNVINPFENLILAKDVRYQFTFTIKDELLK